MVVKICGLWQVVEMLHIDNDECCIQLFASDNDGLM